MVNRSRHTSTKQRPTNLRRLTTHLGDGYEVIEDFKRSNFLRGKYQERLRQYRHIEK